MSINDVESSSYQGTPNQLFQFWMGTRLMAYVGGSSQKFTWNNTDYLPDAAIEMGEINQQLSEASPTVSITITSASEIAQQFIAYLPAEPIQVRVYRTHYMFAPGEYAPEFIGEVISTDFDEESGVCTLLCRMVAAAMQRKVPWCVYSSNCARALYGVGCNADREQYVTVTDIVGGAGTNALSSAAFSSAAADHGQTDPEIAKDWFRNGFVRHVRTNEVRTIIGHTDSTIYLHTPFTSLANGDQVRAYAGCARTKEHCDKKFNNLDRMLAFPWIPGRNPYTQSVYGNESSSNSGSKTNWRKAINPAGWNGTWGLF